MRPRLRCDEADARGACGTARAPAWARELEGCVARQRENIIAVNRHRRRGDFPNRSSIDVRRPGRRRGGAPPAPATARRGPVYLDSQCESCLGDFLPAKKLPGESFAGAGAPAASLLGFPM